MMDREFEIKLSETISNDTITLEKIIEAREIEILKTQIFYEVLKNNE